MLKVPGFSMISPPIQVPPSLRAEPSGPGGQVDIRWGEIWEDYSPDWQLQGIECKSGRYYATKSMEGIVNLPDVYSATSIRIQRQNQSFTSFDIKSRSIRAVQKA